ncbi:MAG TPA: DUF1801 domain-containing protein [Chloroflexia bacterium]|nr:DUF1801 domain-containing protein [Chloroflexia bacterium]
MVQRKDGFTSIDQYIATFPEDRQVLLQAVRAAIREAAPEAVEVISYQMPAFAQDGNLVYFAGLKDHIGFYPTPGGIEAFQDELSRYRTTKGAVNFPVDQPMPLELIGKVVRFRVAENSRKAAAKAARKKA